MGKHSIKNPDTFSDCIEMLMAGAGINHPEYNLDILSERCFKVVFEPNIKTWVHTRLSVDDSVSNLYQNTGVLLNVTAAHLLTDEQLLEVAEEGAVFGPIERSQFNQAVEDMYFLGGKHFVYLAGSVDDLLILHDPDSSPSILVEISSFKMFINKPDVCCITFEKELSRSIDYRGIVKRNILEKHGSKFPAVLPVPNKGIGGMASYKYGLKLYLYYQKEIFDFISKDGLDEIFQSEIEKFFRYAAEGYQRYEWSYFRTIIERGEELLYRIAQKYV